MKARSVITRVAAVVAAAFVGLLAAAPPAAAHAKLLSSSPADGASVNPHIKSITLTFDDVIKLVPRSLVVTGANGAPLTTAPPQLVTSRVMQVKLLDQLTPGRYFVAWRILADDGHIESGSFGFAASRGATGQTAAAAAPAPAPAQPIWPVVVAAVLAVAALAGAALVVTRGARALELGELIEPYPAPSLDELESPSVHVLSRH